MARVLVTNGGPHPPEAWAVATAEHIMPIDSTVAGERLMAAKRLQLAIADALAPHHAAVQAAESAALAAHGETQFATPLDTGAAARAADDVAAVAKATPWEAHFANPEVRALIEREIASHLATAADIERRWWRHRNPSPAAV